MSRETNRCKAAFADVTDPRFGAMGDGVTDDRNAIQAAIESLPPTGGTVYFPLINCAPTTYMIGTPEVLTPPLKYPSNVTFLGDYLPGVGRSTLTLCDNFRQLFFGKVPEANSEWQFTVFAPVSSATWLWPSGPPEVTNVTFRNLAIDGNRDHQPMFYTKSNHGLVRDPNPNLENAVLSAGAGTLTSGTYQFYITYTDIHGVETNVLGGPAIAAPPSGVSGPYLAQLSLPPKPTGAQGVCVYVSETTVDVDAYGQQIYERQAPVPIPPDASPTQGGTLNIISHIPGELWPPGSGLHPWPGQQTNGAILIDSGEVPGTPPTSNIVVDNCEIGNTASDAIGLNGDAANIRVNKCKLHNAARHGIAATGPINGLYVTDTEFVGCGSTGMDFEAGGAREPDYVARLVRVTGCVFNNCGNGMSITPEDLYTSDFVIDSCQFGNASRNEVNISIKVGAIPSRGDSIHIRSCYFGYATSYPMYIDAAGGGTIEGCFFDQTAGPTAFIQKVYNAIPDAPQLMFDGSGTTSWADTGDSGPWGSNWQVLGCSFKPLANDICATSSPCIEAVNGAKNIYIAGCVYVHNDNKKVVPSGAGRLLFNVDAKLPDGSPTNGLANHRFAANYGCLGENGSPAAGYAVGAAATSLTVVFPSTQVSPQYEVCPQFGWDSGNWWVTGQTAAGFTLNWKTGPGNATNLPITIRDAASAPPAVPAAPSGLTGTVV